MFYRLQQYAVQVGHLSLLIDGYAEIAEDAPSCDYGVYAASVTITAMYDGEDDLALGGLLQGQAERIAVAALNADNRKTGVLDSWYAEQLAFNQ